MAPPCRFSNFPLKLEKMSYKWLKLALFEISKNCHYFWSEMEIQKTAKHELNSPSGLGCKGVLQILAAHLIIRLFLYSLWNCFAGDDIRQRALELAAEMNITDFGASGGWLGRFRERNKVALDGGNTTEALGEAPRHIVDDDHVPDWVEEIRLRNERRRLSFPAQASVANAIEDNSIDDNDNYSAEASLSELRVSPSSGKYMLYRV